MNIIWHTDDTATINIDASEYVAILSAINFNVSLTLSALPVLSNLSNIQNQMLSGMEDRDKIKMSERRI